MFVVLVDFVIKAGAQDRFLALLTENAEASVATEEGCRQFDVCTDPRNSNSIFLYEVYDDHLSFELHKNTPHFALFDRETSDLVLEKKVRILRRKLSAESTAQ